MSTAASRKCRPRAPTTPTDTGARRLHIYFNNDVVVVELSLNGTRKGDREIPEGVISPTNKEMHAPCCDVFHLKDGKVVSFHCYVAVSILLEQLGIFKNLSAAIRR